MKVVSERPRGRTARTKLLGTKINMLVRRRPRGGLGVGAGGLACAFVKPNSVKAFAKLKRVIEHL
jgi:hypothetical protein